MKNTLRNLAAFSVLTLALLSPNASAQASAQKWNQGDISAEEQYTLEQLNKFRADPVGYATEVVARRTFDPMVQGVLNSWRGIRTISDEQLPVQFLAVIIRDQASYRNSGFTLSTSPLAVYPLLTKLAIKKREYSGSDLANFSAWSPIWEQTLNKPLNFKIPSLVATVPAFNGGVLEESRPNGPYIETNATGGTATFNSTTTRASGTEYLMANFYAPEITAREWLIRTFTQPFIRAGGIATGSLGRIDGVMRFVGINVATRNNSPGAGEKIAGIVLADMDSFTVNDFPFGVRDTVFITGVVFKDLNSDNNYNVGEGIGNASVTISGSSWNANTGSAGGYAIPVRTGTGSITVNFQGRHEGKDFTATKVVNIGGENVKADFFLAADPEAKPPQVRIPASDGTTRIINLSTRGIASSDGNALIGGIVIRGEGKKALLIRGMASGLYRFGIQTPLAKPLMTIYNSAGQVIATRTTQQTFADFRAQGPVFQLGRTLGAFDADFTATGDSTRGGDTAIGLTLEAGAYTIQITPDVDTPSNATANYDNGQGVRYGSRELNANLGVALLEVYDANPTANTRLYNIASRGLIQTGEGQMIVGFVVSGNGNRVLTIRGVGPALKGFGLATAIDDPTLTLYNSNGVTIGTNDNWGASPQTDQVTEITPSLGAFSLGTTSRDSVILTRLTPGLYSAGVTPQNGPAGIGLVEVYETP